MGPAIGTWGGAPTFDNRSTITSIPLDIRTGFRMFYFLTYFAGLGTSMNFGSSNIAFTKQGPLNLSLEQSILSNSLSPGLQAIATNLGGTQQTGTLTANLRGSGNTPNNFSYAVCGVEINLGIFKLLVEGMVSRHIQSANIGLKIAF